MDLEVGEFVPSVIVGSDLDRELFLAFRSVVRDADGLRKRFSPLWAHAVVACG